MKRQKIVLGIASIRGVIDRLTLNVGSIMIVDAVDRLTLNVGGRRFETTASTLGGHGSSPNFFTQLIAHDERRAGGADAAAPLEYFVDRDGDAFAPVLNYLRTGQLHVPAGVSEASVREEAAFYCVPLPPARPTHAPGPRFDGLYLSFGSAATGRDATSGAPLQREGEVRAYLSFQRGGAAVLGRREADGQWSTIGCRFSCVAGGLVLVERAPEAARPSSAEARRAGGSAPRTAREASLRDEGDDPSATPTIELSAVLVSHDFLEVITCGRVGRIENPFHFVASAPPAPGSTFATQGSRRRLTAVDAHASGPSGGRVVLAFESSEAVGVMVTSSHPGWCATSTCRCTVVRGRSVCPPPPPAIDTPLARAAAAEAAEAADGGTDHHSDDEASPRALRNLGTPRALGMSGRGSPATAVDGPHGVDDELWHVHISGGQFSRTVDFVSLGAHGLVEFVQLGIMHEPQLIWYRPLSKEGNPWGAEE